MVAYLSHWEHSRRGLLYACLGADFYGDILRALEMLFGIYPIATFRDQLARHRKF